MNTDKIEIKFTACWNIWNQLLNQRTKVVLLIGLKRVTFQNFISVKVCNNN